jgi:DNA-binding CsgD family transcriptional regulator
MDTLSLVETTGCAAFVADEDGVITGWNPAAEELLGLQADEVIGKSCSDVICGTDVFGNRFCNDSCSIQSMVRKGEAVRNFQIDVRNAGGEPFRIGLCTLVIREEGKSGYRLVHLFQPMDQVGLRAVAGGPAAQIGGGGLRGRTQDRPGSSLTAREREVLALLEAGVPTQGMADSMKISVTTVRNHIQGILRKLGAHSRLEAVSSARRQGLI